MLLEVNEMDQQAAEVWQHLAESRVARTGQLAEQLAQAAVSMARLGGTEQLAIGMWRHAMGVAQAVDPDRATKVRQMGRRLKEALEARRKHGAAHADEHHESIE